MQVAWETYKRHNQPSLLNGSKDTEQRYRDILGPLRCRDLLLTGRDNGSYQGGRTRARCGDHSAAYHRLSERMQKQCRHESAALRIRVDTGICRTAHEALSCYAHERVGREVGCQTQPESPSRTYGETQPALDASALVHKRVNVTTHRFLVRDSINGTQRGAHPAREAQVRLHDTLNVTFQCETPRRPTAGVLTPSERNTTYIEWPKCALSSPTGPQCPSAPDVER
jgi:hypothetical protein